MKIVSAILAIGYGAVALAQSSTRIADGSATIVSGIDPSDIAAIPDPDLIGPPIGIADDVPCVSYDAAAVTSSVLALVTAATDAQTSIISSGAPSTTVAVKRSFVGGNTNLHRRDSKYPIDTKSFVRSLSSLLSGLVEFANEDARAFQMATPPPSSACKEQLRVEDT